MDDSTSADRARRAVVQRLESLQGAGVSDLPRPKTAALSQKTQVAANSASTAPIERAMAQERRREPAPAKASVSRPPSAIAGQSGTSLLTSEGWEGAPKLPPAERRMALDLICGQVRGCEQCRELATTRTQTVFGVGNPNARLCFMGEAPGADEDAQGEPFVGRAGQLLNKIIEACTLRREDVYILNTIKCRPPGNRNPLPTEVANCRDFLNRQLDIIQPEFICCLGSVAAQALLSTDSTIGKMRKRFFNYRGSRVLCTYHPAYLLRNPAAKKDVWEDMQLLMTEMGIELPKKG
jgi:uracil-DNA glycosylase